MTNKQWDERRARLLAALGELASDLDAEEHVRGVERMIDENQPRPLPVEEVA